ncbi:hypothetical protein ACIBKZ_15740 [Streptomyces sp. NPDC050421]|uniref:hypothetical protein n=1 Tax=Streptomyces sp. NPDC050421 TaxID=3365613 RepID=UPI0037B9DAF4
MTATDAPTRARYRIVHSPLSGGYKIVDEHMGGTYCALPDANGTLRQLRFPTGQRARDWLAEIQRRQVVGEGAEDA